MAESLVVNVDPAQMTRLSSIFQAMGRESSGAIARAVNHTGDVAKTQMIRALTDQIGLKRGVIVKALKVSRASATKNNMTYRIWSSGGNISLRSFGATETQGGVVSKVMGVARADPHAFMRAGGFIKGRVVKKNWNGQVFERTGRKTKTGKDQFVKVKSGVFIPVEMVSGATAEAFNETVRLRLPDRLQHELARVLSGAQK